MLPRHEPELAATTSCLALESDVEGAARSTPQLDHNNRDADTANTAISS